MASRSEHELKGVGQNLSDHTAVTLRQYCTQPISLLNQMKPLNAALSLARYALFRDGPAAHPGIQAVGFVKSRPEIVAPDIQFHFIMVLYARPRQGDLQGARLPAADQCARGRKASAAC